MESFDSFVIELQSRKGWQARKGIIPDEDVDDLMNLLVLKYPLPRIHTEESMRVVIDQRKAACVMLHQTFPKILWCRRLWPYNKNRIGGNREHWCMECDGPEDARDPVKAGPDQNARYARMERGRGRRH